MISILDRRFRYVPSASTNLEKTFARVRREQKQERERAQANAQEAASKVKPMRGGR